MKKQNSRVISFEFLGREDVALVGGKNANLGELCSMQNILDILVPSGFAITTVLYREFINNNNLGSIIESNLLAFSNDKLDLATAGQNIRQAILAGSFHSQQSDEIVNAYQHLCENAKVSNCDVAVRSSATVEDLPDASFAGQQDSFLNVRGEKSLLTACQACFASLYTDRAIDYRFHLGIRSSDIAISVGVQNMVHSNTACAGVIFTLDTETGFPNAVLINAAWGLGNSVVNGSVIPDRYAVFKPLLSNKINVPLIQKERGSKLIKSIYLNSENSLDSKYIKSISTTEKERNSFVLNDDEIILLANWATAIERVYGRPMDIEWAKDGTNNNLYIVQARPETIESRKDTTFLKTYQLKQQAKVLTEGESIGRAIVSGVAFYLTSPSEIDIFPSGSILVTEQTGPDWVPVMKKAIGIVTDLGGPTSHAAIVSRELQVPAIVGTVNATKEVATSDLITLDCATSTKGKVYQGELEFDTKVIDLSKIPTTKTEVMLNIAIPEGALRWWQLPSSGIGLTRIEFIIGKKIKVHPMALLYPDQVRNIETQAAIVELIKGYENGVDYFIDILSTSIAKIAASCYPKPAVVLCSDFNNKDSQTLIGGEYFPIFSGGQHSGYQEAFILECKALKKVREVMGFDNVVAMLPCCRTLEEADNALDLMARGGLRKLHHGLQIYMMCEPFSNIQLVGQLAEKFNGLCIDIGEFSQSIEMPLKKELNSEVKELIAELISVAHRHNTKIGISMQTNKDNREFEGYLVKCGIDSISLNPDAIANAIIEIAAEEAEIIEQNNSIF